VHQEKAIGHRSNEHFIKRDCGVPFSGPLIAGAASSVTVAAIFVQISAPNALIIRQMHKH
jgi:hypothetical protein